MDAAAPTTSVKNRLIKGFAWFAAARIIVNLLTFASSIILARLLMPEDFGLVALATGLNAVIVALTQLPIAEALIQTDNLEDDHFHSAFTLGLARGVMLCVVLLIITWPAAAIYNDTRLIPILLLMALNALISGFYSARWPLMQKHLSFKPAFVMEAASRITSFLVAIPIAYFYRSYWAIVIPITVLQLLSVIITYLYAPYRPRLSTRRVRDIWSFSVWVTLSSMLNTINLRIDTLLIGALLGQRAVGYYSYGDDKAALPSREIGGSMIHLLFPGLTLVKDDPQRLISGFKRIQSLMFAICAPAGVGLALVADDFVLGFLGGKWAPIIPIIQVIAVALAFENLIIPVRPLAMAMGQTRALFRRDVLTFACRTPAIIIGLLMFGIEGVLAARTLSMLVGVGLFLTLARDVAHVPVRDQLAGSSRSIAALGAMALGLLAFKELAAFEAMSHLSALLTSIALGGALYVMSHAAIWHLAGRPDGPEREVSSILQGFARRRARQ